MTAGIDGYAKFSHIGDITKSDISKYFNFSKPNRSLNKFTITDLKNRNTIKFPYTNLVPKCKTAITKICDPYL